MLISQLIIAPVLILEAWFYLLYVRRQDGGRARAYDYLVIAAALASSIACLPFVAAHVSGANDKIWLPVLSVLTTFHIFPAILLIGLWLRRTRSRAT